MVWPTVGSRKAKEQNRTVKKLRFRARISDRIKVSCGSGLSLDRPLHSLVTPTGTGKLVQGFQNLYQM